MGLLDGLRVVDLADEKGELCGRLLADLGADVVRVEPPGGAVSRGLRPFAPDGTSLYFAYRNANKRGLTLDLAIDEGVAELRSLAGAADVLIESSPPGVLDVEGLRALNPALVVTSITDFGRTGPYARFVATNDVCVSVGGLLYNSGDPARPPLLAPGALAYDAAGIVGALATLTAYFKRLRSGRGQHVDLSVVQTVAQLTDWAMPNGSRMGFGNYAMARGPSPVYPIYPCADGHVRCVVLSKRQWRAMRAWLGEPDILQDDHWDTILGRLSAPDVIDGLYIELFSKYGKEELAAEAQKRGIAITPVLTPAEVLANEHFRARRTFTSIEGAKGSVASGFFEVDGERQGPRAALCPDGSRSWEPRPAGPSVSDAPPLPFAGLRVLDFGIGGVGVETAKLLGQYGADVIKIESRVYPDFIRTVANSEMNASFASSSLSKRSFGVNCKTPEGREIVHQLVRQSDVIIENSATGVMRSLGVDYDTVKALNPRVVMVSSQMMGSRGPWNGWIGYGPSTRPAGGMTYLWNYVESDKPPSSRAIHPDHLAGRVCALAAVASLIAREGSGRGVHAEVAQVETVVNTLGDLFWKESLTPGMVQPEGNSDERGAPWGVYKCAGEERWVTICVRDDEDWRGLRRALGEPSWAGDARYETAERRIAGREYIDRELSEWTSTREPEDVMAALQAQGVPAGYMTYPSDHARDPHFVARGYPRPIEQQDAGSLIVEGPAFLGSDLPDIALFQAPRLGEHTREVCRELLDMKDADIDRLIEAGVLEVAAES
jgi:crotonobetainyl-CoA:carnitine CoA-transferase CaiB-like acyl-CoA transferase